MGKIVGSIMIPNVIFAVSLLILLYWYCPYCQARCKKYEDQIDQEVDQEKTTAEWVFFQKKIGWTHTG